MKVAIFVSSLMRWNTLLCMQATRLSGKFIMEDSVCTDGRCLSRGGCLNIDGENRYETLTLGNTEMGQIYMGKTYMRH